MKTQNYFAATAFFALLLLAACGKEPSCPEGYTGDNCDQEIKPKGVTLLSLHLTRTSAQTPDSTDWDENVLPQFKYPDVFLVVRSDSEVLWTSSYYFDDVQPGDDKVFNIPLPGIDLDPDQTYYVDAFDRDGAGTAQENDFMGGVSGKFYQPGAGFPTTLTLDCSNCEIAYEATVAYRF